MHTTENAGRASSNVAALLKEPRDGLTEVDRQAIVREAEVARLTGSARSTRFKWERDGKFPRRLCLPGGGVGWRLDEVLDWISNLPRGELKKREAA